jgi:cadmium resistance protein CadD (predicted permease)
MSGVAILLALASTVRPSSLAAVTALLLSNRPKRLLLAYILAGFVVSVVIGVLVVTLLHQLATKHHKGHAWFELGLGVIALAGAALVVIRERRDPEHRQTSGNGEGKIAKRLRNPSIAGTGVVGILTHAPGAFYLAALDAIIETRPHFVDGVIQVLVYNLIWFAVPIAALILSMVDLEHAQTRVETVASWARRHERIVGPLILAAVGVYLVVKALVKLL